MRYVTRQESREAVWMAARIKPQLDRDKREPKERGSSFSLRKAGQAKNERLRNLESVTCFGSCPGER